MTGKKELATQAKGYHNIIEGLLHVIRYYQRAQYQDTIVSGPLFDKTMAKLKDITELLQETGFDVK